MRIIVAGFAGLVALAAVLAQATPSPNEENWRPLTGRCPSRSGERAAATGCIQALWRDWRGDWWWGPCVPNR